MASLLGLFVIWPMIVVGPITLLIGITSGDGGLFLLGGVMTAVAWWGMGRINERNR